MACKPLAVGMDVDAGYAFVVGTQFKYVWRSDRGEEQLFDLWNDPGEKHSVAGASENQAVLSEMRKALIAEYAKRPEDHMLNEDGTLRSGAMLPHYRKPLK